MGGRQFNSYATQYKAYNVIDDIVKFFSPQTAEGFSFTIGRPPPITTVLKDVAKFEGKEGLENQFKDSVQYNVQNITKTNCTGCKGDDVQERVPGFPNNCYCRKRGDWVYEAGRMLEIIWQSVITSDQQAYASEYSSNCVYYSKSQSYPRGRFCWRNKPCGQSSNIAICTNGGSCSDARARWIWNYGCKGRSTNTNTGGGGTSGGGSTGGTSNAGCTTALKQRCGNICVQKGKTPYLDSKCSCFCKSSSSSKPCPYSGCSSSKAGSQGCYRCRCASICKSGGYPGVKSVSSSGECHCNPKGGASGNISKLTSGCSYSGCNQFTGMTRCNCRCSKICAKKGGVKSVSSSGGCNCKGVQKSSSGGSSGGCSTYLKQRCGNICVQKGGRPYLDSKCSCFCRK